MGRIAQISKLSILVAIVLISVSGCVRRRLFVSSNPAGALVYVDNEQIGTTPCAVDFTYYGTRELRLVKPGFETLTVNQPIPTPWYEFPPLDFFSENIVPTKIHDNRSVSYTMIPQVVVAPGDLINRGNQLRQQTMQSGVVPAAAIGPVPVGPPTGVPTFGPPPLGTPPLGTPPLGTPPLGTP